jgi:LmbE family N-acetylglucosaminyl deacetylase
LPTPSPGPPKSEAQSLNFNRPTALIFSPHPDDECIIGALPLRLQREHGWRIVNIAVTLGSDPSRRDARRAELQAACALLRWNNLVLGWDLRRPDPSHASTLAGLIGEHRPSAIFYPHGGDGHPTHVAVHHLVRQACSLLPAPSSLTHVLTEFWHPMEEPNFLVECPPDDLALLVEALACHAGEVARNPYHLRLPAWMIDNVRRGAERVFGPGAPAPAFPFGTLYHADGTLPVAG